LVSSFIPVYYLLPLDELRPPDDPLEEEPEELFPPPFDASPPFFDTSFLVRSLAEARPLLEEPPRDEPEDSSVLRDDDLPPLLEERSPSSASFLLRF
jgi:hypothetical protein